MKKITTSCMLLCALLLNQANAQSTQIEPEVALKMLNDHTQNQLRKQIVKVSDNVYTAVGYHGATTSMIVGTDGVIIIDTLMGPKSAKEAYDDMRKAANTNKPVKAIILTHSHQDHIGGASVFTEGKNIPIYTAENFGIAEGATDDVAKIKKARNVRQFGRTLPKSEQTNRGVAPAGIYDKDMGKGYLEPTIRIKDNKYTTTIAGVDLEFYRIKGETDDSLFIWLPKNKVLFTGDNFYQAFPNLYAIRGTGYRDVVAWSNSAAQMANMNPEHVVAGHTTPISGKEAKEALQNYSDAIRYVYEQTVKGMNEGKSADILVQEIKLPENLKNKSYLTEFYGTIPHAIRNIYVGLLGWFDGNPVTLNPLSQKQKAQNIAKLVGGVKNLEKNMQKAMEDKKFQWALELADTIKWLEGANKDLVKQTKIKALRELAKREYNAPNRNYYLSYANELESGKLDKIWH